MDDRVREFVQAVAQSVVGLDVALFYQANPSTFDTPLGIALRTHRHVKEVLPALERLAEKGVLERHTRGEGRFVCYALAKDADIWALLCGVSEAYLDSPADRKEIIRLLVSVQQQQRQAGTADGVPGGAGY
jgi:hypothetical protein